MKKILIIPARYSSTRLPGKPLKDIAGLPMIVRVCQVATGEDFDQIVVATDDSRIFDVVEAHGYQVVMTKADHISGTDRLQEAASLLGLDADDIIVNLQGDEPLMPYPNLLQVMQLLIDKPQADVATLFEPMSVDIGLANPNMVKLVQAYNDEVLYFSRAGIPFDRDQQRQEGATVKRHVGIYAYRKKALDAFVRYPEGMLEHLEKLEQLRFMEHGHRIVAVQASHTIPVGVDTEDDLVLVRRHFESAS